MSTVELSQKTKPEPRVVKRSSLFVRVVTPLIYVFLSLWAVIVVYPLAWTLYSALKTDREIIFTPWSFPAQLHFENFARAWTKAQIGDFFFNTLLVVIPSLVFTLLLSAMVAYVMARFEFRGKKVIYYLILAGMMFPIFLALVPLYFIMQFLGLRNTFGGLILVYIAFSLPFTVFFLVGFFRTLPKELIEASIIDGATHTQTFFKVMLPLAQPGLVTMAIFNFLGQWNQFILPTLLMDSTGLQPGQTRYVLAQGLYFLTLQQGYQNDWSGLFAAVSMVMLPTLLVYIIFQEKIEKGLTVGALKG
jgi:N-acetylglucosamine transport system permease protein